MSRLSSTPPAVVDSSAADTDARLRGGWLRIAWVLWVILALPCLVNFLASIPNYLLAVQASCQPGACVAGQPTTATSLVLRQFGLSVGAYATISVALVGVTALVYCGAAAIIVWRKPSDWMALLVSSMFVTQGLYENNFLQGPFDNLASPWHVVGLAIAYTSPVQVLAVCALFPNGKFVSRWIGWTLLALCLIDVTPSFFPAMPLSNLLESFFVLSAFPLVAGSMVYRYRRASTPVEQQQTKWVVFGLLVVFVAFMAWFIPQIILFGSLSQPGSLYDLIGHPLFTLASLAIPICVTIAILRYRLWDIDVIINKALVYGSLTLLLTALYAGLIIGLESLTQIIAGRKANEPVVLVISTLAIAAFFQPARTRIQHVIDRRFYRRKYNADKTVASFGAMVRNEVDLNRLCEQLIAVVDETMQSTHTSLWLRHPQHSTEQPTRSAQQSGNR
jgi:hypothetical protein